MRHYPAIRSLLSYCCEECLAARLNLSPDEILRSVGQRTTTGTRVARPARQAAEASSRPAQTRSKLVGSAPLGRAEVFSSKPFDQAIAVVIQRQGDGHHQGRKQNHLDIVS